MEPDANKTRATSVRYAAWVERVFTTLAGASATRPQSGGVGLTAVAEGLGLGPLSHEDFAAHDERGEAIMTAMSDLGAMGLVSYGNVSYGNQLTSDGRNANALGLGGVKEAAAAIPLSDAERTLLAKLYLESTVEGGAWADLAFVDADTIWTELAGGAEYEDKVRLWTALGDLKDKGLLVYRHPSCRPTYLAAVILAEPDPRSGGVIAGLIDWSVPTPGWEAIEDRISDMKVLLAAATSTEDLQDVNRRCRDLAADALGVVFLPSMVPDGMEPPSPQDAERRLGLYMASDVAGKDVRELRGFLKASLALANAGTHSGRKARAGSLAAAQGMLGFVRALQSVERASEVDE